MKEDTIQAFRNTPDVLLIFEVMIICPIVMVFIIVFINSESLFSKIVLPFGLILFFVLWILTKIIMDDKK